MGCPAPTRADDLLKSWAAAYALARSSAEAPGFQPAALSWGSSPLADNHWVLLVANCSLGTLALITEAKGKGWRVVIEDCPFSRSFIARAGTPAHGAVEFQPGHRLPARFRELRGADGRGPALFVSFCDRPMQTTGDGLEFEVAGSRYCLSILDALLMVAAFDAVFVLGQELREVPVTSRPDPRNGRISGEALVYYTGLCGQALAGMIAAAPGQYLGYTQLVTRGAKYRLLRERGKRSLVKSLLHHCQISGLTIPEPGYRRLLLELEVPREGTSAAIPS
jgi:hypothetical protein